jgi:hypothetical protein
MKNLPHTVSIGLIDATLTSVFGAELGSGENTHEATLRFIAQLVQHSKNEDLLIAIVKARLPNDYAGNTLKEIPMMIGSAIEKGFDQPPNKAGASQPKQSTEAMSKLQLVGMSLCHDKLGKAYATFEDYVGGCIVIPIESSEMKKRIQFAYFEATERALAQSALTEVIDTLNAQASFKGKTEKIHLRIGSFERGSFIDRGAEKRSFIKLFDGEWSVVNSAPLKFRRPAGFEKLPVPTRDADPTEMQELLGLDDDNFVLFVAYLLMCLNPRGPYMLLLVQSGQGSGKSYLCSVIKMIIDPSIVVKQRIPSSERDLAIQAKYHYLLSYDNASNIKNDMSDSFCTLATGGAYTTRKLYMDDEAQIFQHIRPVAMNGIGDYAYRPDLLERSILLNLSPIPEYRRKTEREMDERFNELLPGFLGYLYDCAAFALDNLDKVDPPRSIRMADAAHFAVAAEPASGFKQGRFLQALEKVRDEIMIDRAVNDSLSLALQKVLKNSPKNEFDGRVGELFDKIAAATMDQRIALPKSPSALSNALKRSEPMWAKIGLMVEFGPRSNQGRNVRVWLIDNDHRDDHEPDLGPEI